jgi:triacylglycerol lipase
MHAVRLLSIPIWAEGRIAIEYAALLRDPVLHGRGVEPGDGRSVLLIPGFLAGDPSLGTMARWLRDRGYRPCRARMRLNVDCTTEALDRLEVELERLAVRDGRKVAIVGQSRGGSMARLLAVRRPDLVDRIVCLGSPLVDELAVHPFVRLQITALGALGTLGVPGLFRRGCRHGPCCEVSRELTTMPVDPAIAFVSLYSRTDGIVDWHACLHPDAEQVEVGGSHVGMGVNPRVFRAVGAALAGAGAPDTLRAAA